MTRCKTCRQVFVAQNVEGSHANCAQLGALTITRPKLAEAKREGEEHETASGHSLKAWWMFLQYIADETE